MTNQMKFILKIGLFASGVVLVAELICLFVGGVGYLHAISYVALAVTAVLFIVQLVLYINTAAEYRALKRRIAYYKLLKNLRNKAILDFYKKFGLTPQYDKNGRLLTPDEILGILTKLDAEGNLDPSIYEMLGILPQFDKDGKEIPTIIVLKHLIKSIKKEGLKDIKKFKGLYLKGSKKEKPKEKPAAKKEQKAESKKSKKKKEKVKFAKLGSEKSKKKKAASKGGGKKPEKKPDKKPKETKKIVEPEKKPEEKPIITKVDVQEIEKRTDYFSRVRHFEPTSDLVPPRATPQQTGYETGECTPD